MVNFQNQRDWSPFPNLPLKTVVLKSPFLFFFQEPLIEQGFHETGWPCFRYGRLEMRAEIGRSGFKQGDDIHMVLLITNETSRDVTCTEVSLVQRTLFVDIEGTEKARKYVFRTLSKLVLHFICGT